MSSHPLNYQSPIVASQPEYFSDYNLRIDIDVQLCSGRYRGLFLLNPPLKICEHHIQLTSGWVEDTLLITDAGRGFRKFAEY